MIQSLILVGWFWSQVLHDSFSNRAVWTLATMDKCSLEDELSPCPLFGWKTHHSSCFCPKSCIWIKIKSLSKHFEILNFPGILTYTPVDKFLLQEFSFSSVLALCHGRSPLNNEGLSLICEDGCHGQLDHPTLAIETFRSNFQAHPTFTDPACCQEMTN